MLKSLNELMFNRNFRTDQKGAKDLKVISITPICKECAEYIQSEIFRNYLEQNKKKDEESDEDDNIKGNRVYNKARKMKFIWCK